CGRATAKRSRASAGRGRSVRATGLGEGGVMSGEAFEQREHTLAHARLMARPSAPGGRLAAVGEKPVVRPRQGGNIAIAGAPAELALAATDIVEVERLRVDRVVVGRERREPKPVERPKKPGRGARRRADDTRRRAGVANQCAEVF